MLLVLVWKNGMNFVQRKEENLKINLHLQRTFNQTLQFHSFCPKPLSHKKIVINPPSQANHKTIPSNNA